MNLRVLAAFILIQAPFIVVIHSNAIEAFRRVVNKVVARYDVWKAEKILHLLKLRQRVVYKLVTVDNMNLVLGKELEREKICSEKALKEMNVSRV